MEMFVFPAFNNNFKKRKRTFKCCTNCRTKRIKCSLSKNYESIGCDHCIKVQGTCDLVSTKQIDSNTNNDNNNAPSINNFDSNTDETSNNSITEPKQSTKTRGKKNNKKNLNDKLEISNTNTATIDIKHEEDESDNDDEGLTINIKRSRTSTDFERRSISSTPSINSNSNSTPQPTNGSVNSINIPPSIIPQTTTNNITNNSNSRRKSVRMKKKDSSNISSNQLVSENSELDNNKPHIKNEDQDNYRRQRQNIYSPSDKLSTINNKINNNHITSIGTSGQKSNTSDNTNTSTNNNNNVDVIDDDDSEDEFVDFSDDPTCKVHFVSTADSLMKILNLPFTRKDGSNEIKKSNSVTTFQAMASNFIGTTDATAVFIQVSGGSSNDNDTNGLNGNNNTINGVHSTHSTLSSPSDNTDIISEATGGAIDNELLSSHSCSPDSLHEANTTSGLPDYKVAAWQPKVKKRSVPVATSNSENSNNNNNSGSNSTTNDKNINIHSQPNNTNSSNKSQKKISDNANMNSNGTGISNSNSINNNDTKNSSSSDDDNNTKSKSSIAANQALRDMLGVFVKANERSSDFKNAIHYGPFSLPKSLFGYLQNDCNCFEIGLSKKTQYNLIKLYFKKFNNILPILSEESSLTTFKNNHMPTLILYALILLASRLEGADKILKKDGIVDIHAYDRELEFKVRTMIKFNLDTNRLTLLRTCTLLSLYGGGGGLLPVNYRSDALERSSMDLTTAIHHAFTLGIHHNHYSVEVDTNNKNSKRDTSISKTWWCLFILDRLNCLINSRTMIVNRRDSSLPLPVDKDLNGLVQAAIRLEKVLSFYQPYGDNRSVPKDIDFDVISNVKSLEVLKAEKKNVGAECLRRLIVCITIMFAQKRRYDLLDPTSSNYKQEKAIPDEVYSKAALQILNITSQYLSFLPVITFIPYSISYTLSCFLRLDLKPIKNEDVNSIKHDPNLSEWRYQTVLNFLNSLTPRWWYAGSTYKICSEFLAKLENSNLGRTVSRLILNQPKNELSFKTTNQNQNQNQNTNSSTNYYPDSYSKNTMNINNNNINNNNNYYGYNNNSINPNKNNNTDLVNGNTNTGNNGPNSNGNNFFVNSSNGMQSLPNHQMMNNGGVLNNGENSQMMNNGVQMMNNGYLMNNGTENNLNSNNKNNNNNNTDLYSFNTPNSDNRNFNINNQQNNLRNGDSSILPSLSFLNTPKLQMDQTFTGTNNNNNNNNIVGGKLTRTPNTHLSEFSAFNSPDGHQFTQNALSPQQRFASNVSLTQFLSQYHPQRLEIDMPLQQFANQNHFEFLATSAVKNSNNLGGVTEKDPLDSNNNSNNSSNTNSVNGGNDGVSTDDIRVPSKDDKSKNSPGRTLKSKRIYTDNRDTNFNNRDNNKSNTPGSQNMDVNTANNANSANGAGFNSSSNLLGFQSQSVYPSFSNLYNATGNNYNDNNVNNSHGGFNSKLDSDNSPKSNSNDQLLLLFNELPNITQFFGNNTSNIDYLNMQYQSLNQSMNQPMSQPMNNQTTMNPPQMPQTDIPQSNTVNNQDQIDNGNTNADKTLSSTSENVKDGKSSPVKTKKRGKDEEKHGAHKARSRVSKDK